MSRSRFLERQHRFFAEPDVSHFFWQTRNPYFARTECDLLEGFPLRSGQIVLELGCGEGGNLVNLLAASRARPRVVVGCDLFHRKLVFAKDHAVPARFVCGDAVSLPFRDGAFDAILCRDLLHHLENREPALEELRRVCHPSGTVWIIEPNGANPLIRLLALVRPHERGQLRNSVDSMRRLLVRYFPRVDIDVRQPLPLHRLLLHYQFGLPCLGRARAFSAIMDVWERGAHAVWPRKSWAYIIARLGRAAP